jgi:hypothetical protein
LGRWALLILIGIVMAVAARSVIDLEPTDDSAAIEALMAIAPIHLQQSIPEAELLDIEVRSDSAAEVQYLHDRLYDVVFTYRRSDELRTITAPYGLNGESWITPTKVEMRSRDESAMVVR